jgi:hypothetical protein
VTADAPRVCGHWDGAEQRHCHTVDGVRAFLTGMRCPDHTPRALQGLPEIPPGPGLPERPQPEPVRARRDTRPAALVRSSP